MRILGILLLIIFISNLIQAQTKVSNNKISISYGKNPKKHINPEGDFVISLEQATKLYFYLYDKKFNLIREVECPKISTNPEPLYIGSTFADSSYLFFYINYYPQINIVAYIIDDKNEIKTKSEIYVFDKKEEIIDFLNIENKILLVTNNLESNVIKIIEFSDTTFDEIRFTLDGYNGDVGNFKFKYSLPFNKENQIKLPDNLILINDLIKDENNVDLLVVDRNTGRHNLKQINIPFSTKVSYSSSTLWNDIIYNFTYNQENFIYSKISTDSFEIIERNQYSDNINSILSSPVFKHNRSLSKLYQSNNKSFNDIYLEFNSFNLSMSCTYSDNEKIVLKLNKYIPPETQYNRTTVTHNSFHGSSYQLLLPSNAVEKCFYSVINTIDNTPVIIDNFRSIDEKIYKIKSAISEDIKYTTSFYFFINNDYYFGCIDKKNKELNLFKIDKNVYWP